LALKKNTEARRPTQPLVRKIKSTVDDPILVARRRAQITSAAINVFSKIGYHRATIRDVAQRAQVSVGLIYQYFEDKEDLLFLALIEILEAYKQRIPEALAGIEQPLPRFIAAVRSYCRTHGQSIDATVLAYRETASLSRPRRNLIKQMEIETNELIAQCVRQGIEEGVFEPDTDVEFFCYQVIMFSHAWALKAWNFGSRMSVDQYLERGLKQMLRGVLTVKGRRQFASLDLSVSPPLAEKRGKTAKTAASEKTAARAD
jgi:AcrR family transcriptional regulator